MRIKCIVNALGSCGDSILPHEHLDGILKGLPKEYGPVIESMFEPLSIGEVEALLLVHEARMKKFQKRFADSPSVNVAQVYNSSSNLTIHPRIISVHKIDPIILEIVVTSIVAVATFMEAMILTTAVATVEEAMALAVLEVVVEAAEAAVIMQIFSAKFASNWVTQQQCHFCNDSNFQPNASLMQMEPVFQSNSSNTFGSEQNQGTNTHKDSQPSAMLVDSENQDPNSTTWIPDSGASFHVTGESQNIQQLGPFEGPDQIYIDNGQGLSIKSSGYTKFVSPINPRVSLSLKQYYMYLPSLKT